MQLPQFLINLTGGDDKPTIEQASEIFNLLDVVKVKKRQVLLNVGEVCDKIYIVKRGIIKACIIDEKGALHSIRFVADNDVISSMDSFIKQTPSSIHLECVEPGEIRSFKFDDFEYMSQLYPGLLPAFYEMMLTRYQRSLDEKCRMISRDATDRYLKFAECYPAIINRLPLKEVASFLGIRQQSLSRLRGKLESEGK